MAITTAILGYLKKKKNRKTGMISVFKNEFLWVTHYNKNLLENKTETQASIKTSLNELLC